MAITYSDPWSGQQGSTCSVATAYAAKHAQSLKDRGLTEAQWVAQKHYGTWGVVKGKLLAGNAPELPFATWKISDSMSYKIGVIDGKIKAFNPVNKVGINFTTDQLSEFEDFWIDEAIRKGEWEWLGVSTPKVGPIKVASDSVGAMTDEDVAVLFVKTKDKFAADKGINIKGANPSLDNEVYQAIANEIGYTAAEAKAKVEAYKATGKKLSSLKKKTIGKKAPTKTPSAPPPQPPVNVPDPPDISTFKLDLGSDPDQVAIKKHDYLEALEAKVIEIEDLKYMVDYGKSPVGKQAAQEILDGMNGPTSVPPATMPKQVPTTAADDVVSAAAEAISEATPEYLDESVAKAYIKAKDQLAASDSNPWTLYTQNNSEFDANIYNLMAKSYDIDLGPEKIKAQIANYIATQKKLSVLKKQMAKTGEYSPQADSLKKKKGDPSTTGTTTKTGAQQEIADAADAGYVPEGAKPVQFSESDEELVFEKLKNSLYAGMQPESVYNYVESSLANLKGIPSFKDASLLDMIRAYDKKKSAQLGIENGNFYEKKIAEYASSPSGQAKILAQKNAKELEANLPPLPADSAGFTVYQVEQARTLQREMTDAKPWTAKERDGLRTYTGGSYRAMNGALRQGRSPISPTQDAQSGMRPTTAQLLVHRGTGFSQFGVSSYEEVLSLVGKTVQDKGFLSTSVGGRGAFSGEVNMEVEVPKGTHAAFVKDISNFSNENEFLLAAGTQYEVLTVTRAGYQTTVRVRAIPGSHTRFS